MRPLRVLRGADRIGLVYSRPYPLILTNGIVPPDDGRFMAIVLPVECADYLPHLSSVSIDVQKKYAAQITGLAVSRDFFADSKAAFESLDAVMDKVAGLVEVENRLSVKSVDKRTLEEVKAELSAPIVRSDADTATMIASAEVSKGSLAVEKV